MRTVYNSLNDIPEAVRGEYEEQGGKFVLKLEGDQHPAIADVVAEANRKVGEFRTNNISINQKLSELTQGMEAYQALGSVDELAGLKNKVGELETKAKGSKSNEDVQAMITAALKPLQDSLTQERDARRAAEQAASQSTLESTLTKAGIKAGVNEQAIPDYLTRGKGIFSVVDGQVVAMKDGAPVYSSKRPGQQLSVEEWADDLQAEAPHLYKPSGGAGATPGDPVPATRGDARAIGAGDISDNLEDVALGKAVVTDLNVGFLGES